MSSTSSSRKSRLITTTGGGFCSGRDSDGGPGEFPPRPRRCRRAKTNRLGIDIMMTTSSSDI